VQCKNIRPIKQFRYRCLQYLKMSSDNVIDLTSSYDENDDNDADKLCNTSNVIGVKRNQDDDHSSSSKKGGGISRSSSTNNYVSASNRALMRKMRIKSLDGSSRAAEIKRKKHSLQPIDFNISSERASKRSCNEKFTEFDIGIYTGDGDDAVVSTGILPLIAKLHLANVATCLGPINATWPSSLANRLHMLYIMQNDRWSCGFRNLQMVLGPLMMYLPDSHRIRKQSNNIINNRAETATTIGTTFSHIPSVRQLQGYMEESWKNGFDQKGAKHFNHRVRGRKSKIGAVEVSSLLAYMNIDSTVVQFVACPESRSKLGNFVWAYFNRKMGCCSCHKCILHRSSVNQVGVKGFTAVDTNKAYSSAEHAHHLLSISSKELSNKPCTEYCEYPLLPLYLQWEGHSVTIVGIEKVHNTATVGYHDHDPYQLLVFDPVKSGTVIKDKIMVSGVEDQSCRMRLSTQCLDTMKLSTKVLLKKDCQVVLCTSKPVTKIEKDLMKNKPQVVTAAWDAVETYVSTHMK